MQNVVFYVTPNLVVALIRISNATPIGSAPGLEWSIEPHGRFRCCQENLQGVAQRSVVATQGSQPRRACCRLRVEQLLEDLVEAFGIDPVR